LASKRFDISYPDGSKRKVNASERQQMELRDELQRIGAHSYVFTGVFVSKHFTCKGFAGLNALIPDIEERTAVKRHFLPGQFVVEYPRRLGGQREHELLQTPEAMKLDLQRRGMPATGFSEAAA
jgi:hypothetical protein